MSTSSGKGSYHHGDLREALVAAGLAILEEGGGPTALSLREAARRAGVSAMAPYRHFADKDALLAAVAEIGFGRLRDALAEADRNPDPQEALIGQGVAYVGFACANPALFRLMFGTSLACGGAPAGKPAEATYAVLAGRVATLAAADQAPEQGLRCWAIAHGIAALAVDRQLPDLGIAPTALADRLLRLGDLTA